VIASQSSRGSDQDLDVTGRWANIDVPWQLDRLTQSAWDTAARAEGESKVRSLRIARDSDRPPQVTGQSGIADRQGCRLVLHNIDLSVEGLVGTHWACIRQSLRRAAISARAANVSKTSKTMTTRTNMGNPTVTRGVATTVFAGNVIVSTAE
jgi:hypothetical protein